ncbi:nucleotidyltransferase domain-containing protein [Aphanizomenon flos-aquae NRERC-008]|uniref:Nucleotidyltransferase domain-containing protein n=1 Tax=Aphanizomenon flos-aquae FACHB-1249 TaxID=2692889 RepID=A0ABR8IYB3_APHFL|nr:MULTISPECIES: nucleotidyltransferase domain-containing protein [Aphanizomenon]MBD2391368.1 nucleotidyltransferase domain-containing protein [Aphanizomenon flos-aquae FACHB-1171]MBD2557277.1 nucleotidyltransferase domain-containing protein [Aphanizomenon flos-aquae FACHB-1290]MBD2633434.1 nucleotidyltransferase domain-containing protein [Aphanizomenon sp. FACHB-1399]MBD2644375.1 nucleotidyltransferase domain-containing protein [Aphanizomenon sp. FACHB-1401]MBD2656546.1 nucleotidyltransferase
MQKSIPTIAELQELSSQIPERIPYLKMLVLFGSRATGNTKADSDWDFAVLCDEEKYNLYIEDHPLALFAIPGILGEIFKINSDKIDIVKLNYSSKLIAHFVARDGKVLYEESADEFEKFKQRVLLSNTEITMIRKNQLATIENFLQRWEV